MQRIHLALDQQEQAIQSGNLAALDSLWSGDKGGFVFGHGNADTTWAAYRNHPLGPELDALQELSYCHDSTQVRTGSDMAVAIGLG